MESILIYGLIEGLMIALVSFSLSMIYSGLRLLDISVGGVYVAASYFFAFTLYLLRSFGSPLSGFTFALSFVLSIGLCIMLYLAIEKAVYLPFFRKKAGSMTGLIVSLALFTTIINVIAMIAGTENMIFSIPENFDASCVIGKVIISRVQYFQFIVSVFLLSTALYLLNKTTLGRKIIALADNPVQFQAIGFDVPRTRLYIIVLAAVLISSASILKSIDVGIDPFSSGFNIVLIAAVAMILGGVTNFYGIIAASLFLGLLMNLSSWFFPGDWKMAVVFMVLILMLLFRKQGFFAQRLRLEEEQ